MPGVTQLKSRWCLWVKVASNGYPQNSFFFLCCVVWEIQLNHKDISLYFHTHRQDRGCFPSSTPLCHNFFLSAVSRVFYVGPGPCAAAAPHAPGLAGPCAGGTAQLHPSEELCAFHVCLLHLGSVVMAGESRPWGLSAYPRALPGAVKKGCETKMNLNVPECLLEWHPEPSTLGNYL